MTVKALFILGFPNETKSQMYESINFAKYIKADWSIFNVATPLIGTEMYEEFIMKGCITNEIDFLARTDFRKRIFDTEEISANELNGLQYRANLDVNFINNPNLLSENFEKALELYEDVLGKYPWHIIALYCKKKCLEGMNKNYEADQVMREIKELILTNKRSQLMLLKYHDLMPELSSMKNSISKVSLNEKVLSDGLSIGTKTN